MLQDTARTSWRNHAWTVARLGLAVALVTVVAANLHVQDLVTLWRNLAWLWVAGAALSFWLICIMMSLRVWHMLDRRVPVSALLELTVIQTVTGNLIASSAGVASYIALLMGRYGIPLRWSLWTVLLTRFADGLVLLGCLAITGAVFWGAIEPLHWPLALLIGGLATAALGLGLLFARRQQVLDRMQRLLAPATERVPFLGGAMTRLAEASHLSPHHSGGHAAVQLAYSGAVMLAQFAYSYCSLRMFGVTLDPGIILFVLTFNLLVAMVPIQILGGLGIVEVTSLYLYGLFGIGETTLAPVLLSGRAAFYLINLVTLLYLPLVAWLRMPNAQRLVNGPATEALHGEPQQQ
ncbi:MAG: lysylphosphatidylglycerol synthase transmembrane domain-containing protein [Chloroflexaceae bacterium]